MDSQIERRVQMEGRGGHAKREGHMMEARAVLIFQERAVREGIRDGGELGRLSLDIHLRECAERERGRDMHAKGVASTHFPWNLHLEAHALTDGG